MMLPRRLYKYIEISNTGCLLWRGGLNNGYGLAWADGKRWRAHRLIYEHMYGPIPAGLQIDHLCKVKNCVNHRHMEVVDNRTNSLRGPGPTAVNASKTICKRGHLLDMFNVRYNTQGYRVCRTCENARSRAWRKKMAERGAE